MVDYTVYTTTLSNVAFNEELKMNFTKQNERPELLSQLALEVVNCIPPLRPSFSILMEANLTREERAVVSL